MFLFLIPVFATSLAFTARSSKPRPRWSYSTAYWWSAAFFAAGALITLLLYRRGVPTVDADVAPTVHM
jgi:hypothetical protein